jgi:hypothetical protein
MKQVKVDKLMDAFNAAIKNGFKFGKGQPTLRFKDFKASMAPASGANPGGVYIKGNDGVYMGKIVKGDFIKTRECSDEMVAVVLSVCQVTPNGKHHRLASDGTSPHPARENLVRKVVARAQTIMTALCCNRFVWCGVVT